MGTDCSVRFICLIPVSGIIKSLAFTSLLHSVDLSQKYELKTNFIRFDEDSPFCDDLVVAVCEEFAKIGENRSIWQ